jgi:hypothetical protein
MAKKKETERKMYDVSIQVNEYKGVKNSSRVRFIRTSGLYPCIIVYNKETAHRIAKQMIRMANHLGLFRRNS